MTYNLAVVDIRVYELQAEVYKALANPTRLMIISSLGEGERTVSEIVKELNLSKSNVSQHLNYMKSVGLVCSRKEGRKVYYYISDKRILKAIELVKQALFERFLRCSRIISEEELTDILIKVGYRD